MTTRDAKNRRGAAGTRLKPDKDAGDVLVEYGGEGYDAVLTWVNYTLTPGSEVEYLGTVNYLDTTAINLTGNEFANYVYGNAGDNVINGGEGADGLLGLGGRDRFLFDTRLTSNVDVIFDFGQDDTIVLENTIFRAFAAGPLAAERSVVGPAALEANDNDHLQPGNRRIVLRHRRQRCRRRDPIRAASRPLRAHRERLPDRLIPRSRIASWPACVAPAPRDPGM